jgi:transcriptional regulator with XRE-family HTH domain
MAWLASSYLEFVRFLGIDYDDQEQKRRLVDQLILIRERQGLTQADLAARLQISEWRVARIESPTARTNVSFEMLFKMFAALGYACDVKPKKAATSKLDA